MTAPALVAEDVHTRVLIILSRHGVRLPPEQTNALVRDLVSELGLSESDSQPSHNGSANGQDYGGFRQRAPRRDFRAKAKNPTPTTRRCSACSQEKDLGEFYWSLKRGRKTPSPSSRCKSCVKQRTRDRYMSSARFDALNRVRLEFTARDDEAGLLCADCGEPVASGDEIACESGVRHAECADAPAG